MQILVIVIFFILVVAFGSLGLCAVQVAFGYYFDSESIGLLIIGILSLLLAIMFFFAMFFVQVETGGDAEMEEAKYTENSSQQMVEKSETVYYVINGNGNKIYIN